MEEIAVLVIFLFMILAYTNNFHKDLKSEYSTNGFSGSTKRILYHRIALFFHRTGRIF